MYLDVVWQNFHFIRPFWLLAFVPFLLFFVVNFRIKKAQQQGMKYFPAHLLTALTVGEQGWKKLLPLKLWAVAMTLAIIIAAGPTWLRQASPFGEDTAPLVIVLDVSASMLQKDIQPSRLIRAKQKISDLLVLREGGSTALVVYAGSAHTAMALTRDKGVFTPLLEAVSPKIMPRDGKFAEYSLAQITGLLAPERAKGNPGSVLLVTDGVGNDTQTQFSDYFNNDFNNGEQTLTPPLLLVLGVGDTEKPVRMPFEPKSLQSLANSASGYYHPITFDNSDVEWINNNIQQFMLLSNDSAQPWADMSYGLVFLLVTVFLFWFRRGWTIHWHINSLLLVVLLTSLPSQPVTAKTVSTANQVTEIKADEWHFADLWMTADQQGQYYFNRGDYAQAAVRFHDPMWKASAYYLAEEFSLAHRYFMRVDSLEAQFGAASALAQDREYIAARNLLTDIVKADPDFQGASHNLAIVQKIIDDINRQSESQANTEDEASKELGDEPQTSDGADETVAKELVIKEKYDAEQLLQDDELNQAWMKRVQGNPERFLATKFHQQLSEQQLNQQQAVQ